MKQLLTFISKSCKYLISFMHDKYCLIIIIEKDNYNIYALTTRCIPFKTRTNHMNSTFNFINT